MNINILDLLPAYKEHRRHYIALKHLIDAEVEEALQVSDKEGTELAKALDDVYHLSTIRKEMHELYRRVRRHRQNTFPESGYKHYSIWNRQEVN